MARQTFNYLVKHTCNYWAYRHNEFTNMVCLLPIKYAHVSGFLLYENLSTWVYIVLTVHNSYAVARVNHFESAQMIRNKPRGSTIATIIISMYRRMFTVASPLAINYCPERSLRGTRWKMRRKLNSEKEKQMSKLRHWLSQWP